MSTQEYGLSNAIPSLCTLPGDILGEIFLRCTPVSDAETAWQLSHSKMIFGLSRVCSLWRQVALSHPRLWSYISVDMCLLNEKIYSMIMLHLQRSKEAPLTLCIAQNGHPGPDERCDSRYPGFVRRVYEAFLSSTDRWKTVKFYYYPWPNMLDTFFRDKSFHFPILESLEVNVRDHDKNQDVPLFQIIRSAPRLHTLRLYQLKHIASYPYRQLKHLTIDSIEINTYQYLDVLSRCSNLTELSFASHPAHLSSRHTRTSVSPSTPIRLLSLTSLKVTSSFFAAEALLGMLKLLVTPGLISLHLKGEEPRAYSRPTFRWPEQDLHTMISQSPCYLQKLCLGPFLPITDDSIPGILRNLPDLIELELHEGTCGEYPKAMHILRLMVPASCSDSVPGPSLDPNSSLGVGVGFPLLRKLKSLSLYVGEDFAQTRLRIQSCITMLRYRSRQGETSSFRYTDCTSRAFGYDLRLMDVYENGDSITRLESFRLQLYTESDFVGRSIRNNLGDLEALRDILSDARAMNIAVEHTLAFPKSAEWLAYVRRR
ncbi:hypothetical protein VKT23_011849 [Stygiomarasmius scandens]|uniref:F-box domain-containing protein n=1 Tax=Marasmiellus scandens TaxID=2682957 RepID=A0ABR1JDA9_9AGAR